MNKGTYENGFRDKAIETLEKGLKEIKAEVSNFGATLENRFKKFDEDLDKKLEKNYVTKFELNNCIEEKITGTPLSRKKQNWIIAGIIVSAAIGIASIILNFFGGRN